MPHRPAVQPSVVGSV